MNKLNLDNTLVICNFINDFYDNISVIKNTYNFPNIVFYGDDKYSPHQDIIAYNQSNQAADKTKIFSGGHFAYRSLMHAIENNPYYDGYLFIMDDVFISKKRLQHLNPTMSYMNIQLSDVCAVNDMVTTWPWWKSDYGIEKCPPVHEALSASQKKKLAAQAGAENTFIGAVNDIAYIPATIATEIHEVLTHFSNNEVFTEIAIPSSIAAVSHEIEDIGVKYLWGKDRRLWHLITTALSIKHMGIHPVKLSGAKYRLLFRLLSFIRKLY